MASLWCLICCVWCAAAARLQSKGGGLNDFASGFEGLEANSKHYSVSPATGGKFGDSIEEKRPL